MDFQEFEQKRRRKLKITGLIAAGAALLVLLMCYLFLFHINQFEIDITLNGAASQTMEYGTAYEEAGAKAHLYGSHILKKGMELPVSVTGNVDNSRIGSYSLVYEAAFHRWKKQITRTVAIVDTVAPKIILTYNKDYYVLPNHEYKEEGFTALDNYDGDITSKVLCQDKGGIVHYYVEDSSGNVATVTRKIRYDDPIAPELVLVGEQVMSIPAGQIFTDPGYAASDNYDGDLTPLVQVSGNVDRYRAGTYVLTYEVSDSFGNTTSIARTVHVIPQPQSETVVPTGKVIYLTFDDGPSQYTQKLLDVLNLYNVKATFFVVNSDYIHLVDDMVSQGHSVGMHSVSHNYRAIYANEEAYFNDLYGIQKIIEEQCGHKSTLLRFPGGSSNTVSSFNKGIMSRLTRAVEDLGLQYFDWNVSSGDAEGATSTDQVVKNVINGIRKHSTSIVLQHDTKDFSVDAVERIIIWALENGYTFLALDSTSPTAHHGVNN